MNPVKPNILVIGASGQLARSFMQLAKSAPIPISTIGRPALDLADAKSVIHTIRDVEPSIILNAAAYTAVDAAESNKEEAFLINAEGPKLLAQLAQECDIPLIHISTDYVFGGCKAQPWSESDPTSPLGVYGESKLAGEQAIASETSNHIIFRTAWVYSQYGSNFVKTMLRLAASRDEISVVDDQYGNPTYAPHLAEALTKVCEQLGREPENAKVNRGVFHLAGEGSATWAQLAESVFEEAERQGLPSAKVLPITTEEFPTPVRRPANSRLDQTAAKQVWGIALPPWRHGVIECVQNLAAEQDKQY